MKVSTLRNLPRIIPPHWSTFFFSYPIKERGYERRKRGKNHPSPLGESENSRLPHLREDTPLSPTYEFLDISLPLPRRVLSHISGAARCCFWNGLVRKNRNLAPPTGEEGRGVCEERGLRRRRVYWGVASYKKSMILLPLEES